MKAHKDRGWGIRDDTGFDAKVRMVESDMNEIKESYGRMGEDRDRFDIEFWQSQGDRAIFDAALEMILDYLMIRHGHADQPRLQRTVESFGKI